MTYNQKRSERGTFKTYIQRVLKVVHPECGITTDALNSIDAGISIIGNKLAETARNLVLIEDGKTISSLDVQTAVKLILPGDLEKHAISEGTKAVTKSVNSHLKHVTTTKRTSRSNSAGLQFPVSLGEHYLRGHGSVSFRVAANASVYLTAVLEYITAEILELAGNAARDNKLVRITNRHLFLAIANDKELSELVKSLNIYMVDTGVLPYIPGNVIEDYQNKKHKSSKGKTNEGTERVGRKPHRFLPGTVALRNVRKQQKETDLSFQKAPVERLIRESAQKCKDGLRLSDGTSELIQSFIEGQIVKLFEMSRDLMHHADRQTLFPSDIHLAAKYLRFKPAADITITIKSNLSKDGYDRLAKRAAIVRLSDLALNDVDTYFTGWIDSIVKNACTIVTAAKRRTIQVKDVADSLHLMGYNITVGGSF